MQEWKSLINLDTVTSFKAVEGGHLSITTYDKTNVIIPPFNEELDTYDELFTNFKGPTQVKISSDMMPFQETEIGVRNFDSSLIRKIFIHLIEANLHWIHKISKQENEEILIQAKFEFNTFTAYISINNDLPILFIEMNKSENP